MFSPRHNELSLAAWGSRKSLASLNVLCCVPHLGTCLEGD